jgi:hypothetical protein
MGLQRIHAVVGQRQFLFRKGGMNVTMTRCANPDNPIVHLIAAEKALDLLVAMARTGYEMMSGQDADLTVT